MMYDLLAIGTCIKHASPTVPDRYMMYGQDKGRFFLTLWHVMGKLIKYIWEQLTYLNRPGCVTYKFSVLTSVLFVYVPLSQ